jgi:hypothetical protein
MAKADTQLQRLLAEGAGCAFHQFGYFCNWGLCFRMPTQLCVQRFSPTFALIALCFLRHAPPLVYDKGAYIREASEMQLIKWGCYQLAREIWTAGD